MDIISMQIANKVLKRMNTEFDGAYDIFIATEGQKTFTTTRAHDTSGHTLHIYVNGYHAVSGEDYTHTNDTTFEFKKALRKGDVVLVTTQVVGISKFVVTNPEYDDTAIKNQLSVINNQINNIISAMDEDKDGSIIDTIADIKKQWADADGNIMKLIELKATKEELALLSQRIEEVASSIPQAYDDTQISNKIITLENAATLASQKIEALEVKTKDESIALYDEVSGRKHKVVLVNGVIQTRLVGLPLELTHTAPTNAIIDIAKEFRLNITANADLNQKVKLIVSKPEQVLIEYNDTTSWSAFTNQTIEALTNLSYNLRFSASTVGHHEISISVVKFDNNHELGKTTFTVDTQEPPHSLISGKVLLNGADYNQVLVSLQKTGAEEGAAIGILESGDYTLRANEAGEYAVRLANGTSTHTIKGIGEHAITVELGTNITGKNFELEAIVKEPVTADFITWDEQIFTAIPKAEDNPPYQLMQINYNRLQEVDACRLDIVDADNQKQYHTTPGALTVSDGAMFQWSYRDLSTLLPEGTNLDALERTNTTLLPEGTNLTFTITVTKGEKDYVITAPYTITAEDVANATYNEGGN